MSPLEPDIREPEGRKDLVVSLLFLGLAGMLMILPFEDQERISSALRESVLAPFIGIQEAMAHARVRSVEVSELQARLDSAVAVLSDQRALREENRRLRELLALREWAGPGFVSATVVRPGTPGSESMLVLHAGSGDGVAVHDPVITADGLVGVVRGVSAGSAVAMDWTHPDFRASVMTEDGRAYGIVEPGQEPFRTVDRLLLTGVPYHTTLAEGVPVLTSGLGGVYPRGILVGTVEEVAEVEAGWRRSYWVRPSARPGSVTHILVLTRAAERTEAARELERFWTGPGDGR